MTRLKKLINSKPFHERTMEFSTFPLENGQFVIEGRLMDKRLVRVYQFDEHPKEPGIVHLITARFLVDGIPLSIMDAEAEFQAVPHEQCHPAIAAVSKLIGLPIVHGYTDKVKELLGNSSGCAHLANLAIGMGAAALQGAWTILSSERHSFPSTLGESKELSSLIDTCLAWNKEGSLIKKVENFLKSNHDSKA